MAKYSELFKVEQKTAVPEALETPPRAGLPENERAFTVLFVDDEPGVLNALRRNFLEENYTILTAASAAEALATLEKEPVHLVISDHRMPGMTGAQLLREIKQRWPETIRIMLTGYADIQAIMGAVNEGAVYKFITKPWSDEDLRLTVSLALQQYALIRENKQLKELSKKQSLKLKNYSALFDENRGILATILLTAGIITEQDNDRARREKRDGELLCETLTRLGITEEKDIIAALRHKLKIGSVDLKEAPLSPAVVKFLPRELCEKNRLIPVKLEGKQMTIAMADPSDIYKCDNISLMTGFTVVPLVAGSSDILHKLKTIYGEGGASAFDGIAEIEPLDEIDIVIDDEPEANVTELIGSSEVPPIVRIVNAVISEAVRYQASDIHVEPKTKYSVVRYRIDGLLHGKIRIPAELHAATISRIKILAKMDIAERRRPQDGRITVKTGTRIVDIRVSSMPTINGEKIVMRILDKNAAIKNLGELGLEEEDLSKISRITKKPQGMIISTGPTGSGKTTMLYSLLNAMLEGTKNFETIEDPVEYFLEEANQVYIREKSGLTFPSVLRATLRQDPDVILVGEIRDFETADIAFKAALTGHMVLSTLHTNNSVASITRLMDMGIKPYLIASALEGILAQRLVRKICRHCRTDDAPNGELLNLLKISRDALGDKTFRGKGCEKCNQTGYVGRTGIFEFFAMNDDFRHLISSNYKEAELVNAARASGMRTLIEASSEKVRRGETTLDEIVRVIGPQTRYERTCEKCAQMIDAKFLFCPFCGSFRHDVCKDCKMPLEADWNVCPFCGGHNR